jgi:bla regulator protein blaR1
MIGRELSMVVGKTSLVLGAWAVGVFLSGVPVLLGLLSLRKVARESTPVTDEATLRLAEGLAARVGLKRPVRLIRSPRREIPMTWGVLRPVVLLPADASDWSGERLSTALLHELAHVKRWDCLTQLIARLGCAVYWFNPLSWLALARVRAEQEQACDDLALICGFDRVSYAHHLLAIVTGRVASGPRADDPGRVREGRPPRLGAGRAAQSGPLAPAGDPRRPQEG